MTTVLYYDYLNILTLLSFLLTLTLLIIYRMEIKADDMINYFIYLSNKIVLFVIMISSVFAFLITLNSDDTTKTLLFIQSVSPILFYYILLNYMVFYGIKFFNYCKEFGEKNDLFGLSFIYKKNLNKLGGKKK